MARPKKTGLGYFPLDVDFFDDDKIQLVEAKFGIKGSVVAMRLLCKVYKNGYFYKFGEDECLLLGKQIGDGMTAETVSEIVAELVRRDFFDRVVYEKYGILTSRGIQRRYVEIVNRNRSSLEVNGEIWLLDGYAQVTVGKQTDNSGLPTENTDLTAVNATNKIKENKTKPNQTKQNDNGDSLEYLSILQGEPQNQDFSAPVAADVLISCNDFVAGIKIGDDYVADVAQVTHLTPEYIMSELGNYAADCRINGKEKDTAKGHRSHFRNYVGAKVKRKYGGTANDPTVMVYRTPLSPAEHYDEFGRRVCNDSKKIIPDDAPPRPGNGTRWLPVPKKWEPFGT